MIKSCEYCGEDADGIDHIPPKTSRIALLLVGLEHRYPFIEVPACQQCNSVLDSRALWTVARRRKFIAIYLKRRYRKYLKMPEWSDSELGQLGPNLQRYVIHNLALRERVKLRISIASR